MNKLDVVAFATTKTTFCFAIYANVVSVCWRRPGWAEGRLPACSATLAAPFRGENKQCCSVAPQNISEPQGSGMVGVGVRACVLACLRGAANRRDVSVSAVRNTHYESYFLYESYIYYFLYFFIR